MEHLSRSTHQAPLTAGLSIVTASWCEPRTRPVTGVMRRSFISLASSIYIDIAIVGHRCAAGPQPVRMTPTDRGRPNPESQDGRRRVGRIRSAQSAREASRELPRKGGREVRTCPAVHVQLSLIIISFFILIMIKCRILQMGFGREASLVSLISE